MQNRSPRPASSRSLLLASPRRAAEGIESAKDPCATTTASDDSTVDSNVLKSRGLSRHATSLAEGYLDLRSLIGDAGSGPNEHMAPTRSGRLPSDVGRNERPRGEPAVGEGAIPNASICVTPRPAPCTASKNAVEKPAAGDEPDAGVTRKRALFRAVAIYRHFLCILGLHFVIGRS